MRHRGRLSPWWLVGRNKLAKRQGIKQPSPRVSKSSGHNSHPWRAALQRAPACTEWNAPLGGRDLEPRGAGTNSALGHLQARSNYVARNFSTAGDNSWHHLQPPAMRSGDVPHICYTDACTNTYLPEEGTVWFFLLLHYFDCCIFFFFSTSSSDRFNSCHCGLDSTRLNSSLLSLTSAAKFPLCFIKIDPFTDHLPSNHTKTHIPPKNHPQKTC